LTAGGNFETRLVKTFDGKAKEKQKGTFYFFGYLQKGKQKGKQKGGKQKGTFYFFGYLGLPRGGREDSNSSCVPVDACHGVSERAV
jgi:hypothetical protein